MNLSIKEAEYILAIVSEGNMSRAAQKLYVAQPSLTLTVQKLERQLGTKLFIRENNRMKPTYAGERFVEACNKLVKICRDVENEFEDMNQMNSGKVIIGMPFNLNCYVFPLLYSICQRDYPDIKAVPIEGSSWDLESMLLDGAIDLAVLPLPIKNQALLNSEIILEEQLVLSIPQDHWLNQHAQHLPDSRRPYIDISLTDGEPFVMSLPGQRTRLATETVLRSANVTPKIAFITKNVETKIRMSAVGLGLAVFPEHYLEFSPPPKGANYYYISNANHTDWKVAIIYRKDSYFSKASAHCKAILTHLFKDKQLADEKSIQPLV